MPIKVEYLSSGENQICCVKADFFHPATLNELLDWQADNKEFMDKQLLEQGAILFREFSINSPSALKKFVNSAFGKTLGYAGGNSPRTQLLSGVYTSTEYPPEQVIFLHNELSYAHRWPIQLFFCCCIPAKKGGETPILDGRKFLKKLGADIVSQFMEKQVMYIRNLPNHKGIGSSWQDTFETNERDKVEQYLQADLSAFEWQPDGSLRVTQIRPAAIQHPITGETVWFNQADQFHPSSLGEEYYSAMKTLFAERENEMPIYACFGDGTPINEDILNQVRQVAFQEAIYFPWQEGDLLVIDNTLMLHGRMPFTGSRKIFVAMVGEYQRA